MDTLAPVQQVQCQAVQNSLQNVSGIPDLRLQMELNLFNLPDNWVANFYTKFNDLTGCTNGNFDDKKAIWLAFIAQNELVKNPNSCFDLNILNLVGFDPSLVN